ncbi:MAG TPA: M23 family metallopeptidase, partial [Myxococcota bacterium]|nr:M23 family metallopeptidase [Myxococcota bacterium]
MGRVAGRAGTLALAGLLALTGTSGCRSSPKAGAGDGAWYVVRPGDNLWRISQQTGAPVDALRRVNRVDDVHALQIGKQLWIPKEGGRGDDAPAVSSAPLRPDTLERREAWAGDCSDAAREHGLRFEWPVLGTMTSAYGQRRGRPHDGIDIGAARGTTIHAAEAGKVVYADRLGAYGKLVVVKHLGSWATVYAHNDAHLVEE